VSESEIWQIIQTGNEISVMRTEVAITITVGVLVISSLRAIRLNGWLLSILLSAYLAYGYINFRMLIGEMYILVGGIAQLDAMGKAGEELSNMGRFLAAGASDPVVQALIPTMYIIYWLVTLSTMAYAIWQYRLQKSASATEEEPPDLIN
jgi:multisubunit Na+/H+ antiporter MnhC subunit